MSEPYISLADVEDISFPDTFLRKGVHATPLEQVIYASGPLTSEHLTVLQTHLDSGEGLNVPVPPLKVIRHTHHRLAQYLSMGMADIKAAKLCNYDPQYVARLRNDPAFADLLNFYAAEVREEFTDFVTAAADLSLDMLGQLRHVLETSPERITPRDLMEGIKLLADRTGHAPIAKSVNVNVNSGLGERLASARKRASVAFLDG